MDLRLRIVKEMMKFFIYAVIEKIKNHLYLELAREVEDEAELSFAWQADPIKHHLLMK